MRLPTLVGLDAGAKARVRAVAAQCIDLLLVNSAKAFLPFAVSETRRKGTALRREERVAALRSAQRMYRNAEIEACQRVFDAFAEEYLRTESGPDAFSERLREVAIFLPRILPLADDDRLTQAAIEAKIPQWEDERVHPGKAVGSAKTTSPEARLSIDCSANAAGA